MRIIDARLALLITCGGLAFGAEGVGSLFHPRPDAELRDLSTDRPDTTESPYTVDAGHVQVEWETLSWGRDRSDDVTTTTLGSSVNLKVGLTSRIDLQIIPGWERTVVEDTPADARTTASGMGDTDVRLKYNLWGDDGGATAAAVMPFVTMPTHDRDLDPDRHWAAGLILPVGVTLVPGVNLGVMAEFDLVRNQADDGRALLFIQSATVGVEITEWMGMFNELAMVVSSEAGAGAEAYYDGGFMFGVTPNVQLDCGWNLGLTQASQDVRGFIGVSVRL